MQNEKTEYPNEAYRVPEEFRNIPEKIEIHVLKSVITQQGRENHRLLEKIAVLEEKNALLKATMARLWGEDRVNTIMEASHDA